MSPDAYLDMAAVESCHWWFVGRRSILEACLRRLDLPVSARILEIGAGTGGNLDLLAKFGTVSAIEMDAVARGLAEKKAQYCSDIRAGTFPDDNPFAGCEFELIGMFDVLEHIKDDIGTLREVAGMLTPGGRILLTVPAHPWLWSGHDEFLHHQRRYTKSDLLSSCAKVGLSASHLSYFNSLLAPVAVAGRMFDRLRGATQSSGSGLPPAPLNWLLAQTFAAERFFVPSSGLPFGISMLVMLEKD